MTIGDRIKARRKQLQWSQRDLAAKMNYSHHSTVARIEAGQVDIPQSRIIQFAQVLGVSVAFLMGWNEDKKNDALSDIIIEMRTDEDFMSIVQAIYKMDKDKRSSLLAFLK